MIFFEQIESFIWELYIASKWSKYSEKKNEKLRLHHPSTYDCIVEPVKIIMDMCRG